MIQEVRQEILLKNGLILYTGDLVEIKYKSDEDIKVVTNNLLIRLKYSLLKY